MILPFDAHNHVHMGPTWPLSRAGAGAAANLLGCLGGMAVMSTHPRDFPRVLELASEAPGKVIPCIGVHPWFLHELTSEDWRPSSGDGAGPPKWIVHMDEILENHPKMPVGEIGLDGFHFDPITKDLTCPMEKQVEAMELQFNLAIRRCRPVSLHCVRAMGPVMNTIAKVRKENGGKLPPSVYFHAFGGKVATVSQLVKTLEKQDATKVYFGFAPIINFNSPKTISVIQEVGLDRLVLETDHEDAACVCSSMAMGVEVIAKSFGISNEELIQKTNENAAKLYGL